MTPSEPGDEIPRFRMNFLDRKVEKKVDEGWKAEIQKEKAKLKAEEEDAEESASGGGAGGANRAKQPSRLFVNFLASLVQQAMMQLGRMESPYGPGELDLEGAQATIEILKLLQNRTRGNLHEQEEKILNDAVRELQLIYVDTAKQLEKELKKRGGK